MEKNIFFKVIKGLGQIPKLIVELFIASIIVFIFFRFCSSNPDDIYFDDVNVPLTLEQAGFNESFVKSVLVEEVEKTRSNANYKINNMLDGVLNDSITSPQAIDIVNAETVIVSGANDLFALSIGKYLPRILHKGVTVSCQIIELDEKLMAKVAVYDNRHKCWNIKTTVTKSNTKESLLSLLKQCGAFITRVYDPVASVLYDYNTLGKVNSNTNEEVYENPQYWDNNGLYSKKERNELLQKVIADNKEKEVWAHLVLGNFWEEQHENDSAITQYEIYLKKLSKVEEKESKKSKIMEIINGKIKDMRNMRKDKSKFSPELINRLKTKGCKQLLVVKSKESSHMAKLYFYELMNESWNCLVETPYVHLGKKGIGKKTKEGDNITPEGLFSITETFGRVEKDSIYRKNPHIKYKQIHEGDIWITDDSDSTRRHLYNEMVDSKIENVNGLNHENLYKKDVYDRVIVVNYNRGSKKVWGKGSAIFIHRLRNKDKDNDTHYTLGCIAIDNDVLSQLFEQLDLDKKPHIYISKEER